MGAGKYYDNFREVIINVTNKCNLNCSYCYYKKKSDNMPPEMITSIILSALKCNPKDRINIYFMGGEPTLCLKNISQAINDVKSHKEFNRLIFSLRLL